MKTDEFEGYTLVSKEPIRRWSGGPQHQHVSGEVLIVREAEELRLYIKDKQKWDGTGLPPVGTICEVLRQNTQEWVLCKIHFGSSRSVMMSMEGEDEYWCQVGLCKFRVRRTPEQIAAEERAKAIEEMRTLVQRKEPPFDHWLELSVAGELYDAGYRKQP